MNCKKLLDSPLFYVNKSVDFRLQPNEKKAEEYMILGFNLMKNPKIMCVWKYFDFLLKAIAPISLKKKEMKKNWRWVFSENKLK